MMDRRETIRWRIEILSIRKGDGKGSLINRGTFYNVYKDRVFYWSLVFKCVEIRKRFENRRNERWKGYFIEDN